MRSLSLLLSTFTEHTQHTRYCAKSFLCIISLILDPIKAYPHFTGKEIRIRESNLPKCNSFLNVELFHCFVFIPLVSGVGVGISVQSLSHVQLFVTPWTAACQTSLSITNSQSLLKLMSIESVMPSKHLILCHPLLLLPSIFPSIRVFFNESALLIKWPQYWSFSFNISLSDEHPGLVSFRMDWLDLLAVQETLKSVLQHHSSKASIFWHSAFFIVQLSHPYMTTGKTTALTRRTFVGLGWS